MPLHSCGRPTIAFNGHSGSGVTIPPFIVFHMSFVKFGFFTSLYQIYIVALNLKKRGEILY